MRKIFYSCLFFVIAAHLSAQTPGGLSNSVLWLRADVGATPAAWVDQSPGANNFSQATPLNQPVLNTNVFNFNPALTFNGSSLLGQDAPTGFPTNNSDRTIFVVANATGTTGYKWVFVYGTTGTIGGTCQVGNHDAALGTDFYGNDFEYTNYWDAAPNLNGALTGFTLNAGTASQYDRGNLLQSQAITGLSAPSAHAVIGAINTSAAETWQGNIAEVIVFNIALTDAQRNQVESYLALKYGFTLGNSTTPISYTASDGLTAYWNASTNWQNDVFGIGTDVNAGFQQIQSNSTNSGTGNGAGQYAKGNLVLSVAAPLTDGQFLMIGNDAGALTEQLIGPGEAPAVAVGSQRLARNWQSQNNNGVGVVNLSFDTVGLTLTGQLPADFRLMIDTDGDGDYTTGTVFVAPASITGTQINFTGVNLPFNSVFTLITQAAALLPAVWQSFVVTAEKNKATLVWKTSDEVNVDYYSAEYSTDGVTYKAAGTVTAKNGAGTNTYSLVQDNLPAGIRYYRIKRVDKDGRFELSSVKSIKVVGVNTVSLRSNPVTTGKLDLTIDLQQSQEVIIRVMNTDGKILVQQHIGLPAGSNTVSTNIAGIARGAYFLQVQLGRQLINKKFARM
jgi:hypothetical protein